MLRKIKPVIEEIKHPSDPLSIFASVRGRACSFFLDSGCDSARLGRFSFIGCDPFLVFKSKGDAVTLERSGGKTESFKSDPFTALKKLLRRYAVEGLNGALPFPGGAVGYFSYDMKSFIEDLPDECVDDLGIPDCILGFYDAVITYDNLERRCYVSGFGASAAKLRALKSRIAGRPARRQTRLPAMRTPAVGRARPFAPAGGAVLKSNFSKDAYIAAVEKVKEHIRKGDIYQANLSQRFHAELNMDPAALYARLRAASPAPFASYLDFGDVTVLSSSPERFLLKRGDCIETRPIKGTRPRGADAASDALLEKELKSSAKDAAEHIMIVDLERNDLGRICEYGSVRPTESMAVERYANVFHLVSTVAGKLRPGVDQVDCLRATFPGGSITGAPKIRSMEIIDELEGVKRSVYTGAIGYLSFDGDMDTSIVIRTFVIKGKDIYFQVGGGIVADSDPEKEYEETMHKAQGLMQALGLETPKAEAVPV